MARVLLLLLLVAVAVAVDERTEDAESRVVTQELPDMTLPRSTDWSLWADRLSWETNRHQYDGHRVGTMKACSGYMPRMEGRIMLHRRGGLAVAESGHRMEFDSRRVLLKQQANSHGREQTWYTWQQLDSVATVWLGNAGSSTTVVSNLTLRKPLYYMPPAPWTGGHVYNERAPATLTVNGNRTVAVQLSQRITLLPWTRTFYTDPACAAFLHCPHAFGFTSELNVTWSDESGARHSQYSKAANWLSIDDGVVHSEYWTKGSHFWQSMEHAPKSSLEFCEAGWAAPPTPLPTPSFYPPSTPTPARWWPTPSPTRSPPPYYPTPYPTRRMYPSPTPPPPHSWAPPTPQWAHPRGPTSRDDERDAALAAATTTDDAAALDRLLDVQRDPFVFAA